MVPDVHKAPRKVRGIRNHARGFIDDDAYLLYGSRRPRLNRAG